MNERNTIMEEVLIDMQKSTTQSNKVKDKIIILLIMNIMNQPITIQIKP